MIFFRQPLWTIYAQDEPKESENVLREKNKSLLVDPHNAQVAEDIDFQTVVCATK